MQTPEAPTVTFRTVLRRREFAGLFLAHLLSLLGDRVVTVAVSVLVYDRTGSVLLTAAAYATTLLPWLLGAPLLTAISDRWPRRQVMVGCDLARVVLVLLLAVPGVPLAVQLVLLTVSAALAMPFEAARAATLPVVLPSEQEHVTGSALTMLSNQLTQVVGLAGGGLLLTVLSTRQALVLNSASFAASALLIRVFLVARPAATDPTATEGGIWASAAAGARVTLGDPALRRLLLLAWLVAAVTIVPEGLAVAQAGAWSAPSPVGGLLLAAVPAGAVLGALVLARLDAGTRTRCVLPLSTLGLAALAVSAAAGSWPVLAALWVLVGVGAAVQLPVSTSFLRAVPDAYRGRAFGLAQTGLMAGQGLALLGAGAAAEGIGLRSVPLVAGCGGLVLLAGLARSWPAPARPPRSPRSRSLSRQRQVDLWIACVTVLAAGAVALALQVVPTRPAPWTLPPLLLGAVFAATGSYVATTRIGRQAHVFQLDDVPRLVGLVLVSPLALVLARLGGAAVALVAVRRQRGRKLVFNLAHFALEVSVALMVFAALDTGSGVGPSMWPAALAATLVADLVSAWVVGVVIGLAEGALDLRRVLVPDRVALGTALGAAAVGMIAATTLWYAPSSGTLILLLVALGVVGLRGFARLGAEREQQQQLQRVVTELGQLEPEADSLRTCLEGIRSLLGVEALACHVSPVGTTGPLSGWHTAREPDSALVLDVSVRDRLAGEVLAREARRGSFDGVAGVLEDRSANVLAVPALGRRHRSLRRDPAPEGQWLAVPLSGERGPDGPAGAPAGVLLAVGPIGDNRVLGRPDAEALETVAGVLGLALRRVEHQRQVLRTMTHDRLTGYASPVEFAGLTRALLATGGPLALLLVDLDRLRAVNDVFGRHTGDRVLVATADRIRRFAPDGSALGRVSGHHFACAFPVEEGMDPSRWARSLRVDLERPLDRDGVDVEGGVRIGISLAPQHGRDPDVLLRRAESAGRAARQDPYGVTVFTQDLERDSARSLRLITDLRAALVLPGQLSMHFQPKCPLRAGAALGWEALLRWQHPDLGPVAPSEFIDLAESTSLIGDLTAFALDESLAQSARWLAAGLPATVAVNLSARTLLDDDLVDHVARALARHGSRPDQLVLEITETSVMARPDRSDRTLRALRGLGVRLSVDDFGTGYANLGYLRALPVQEVKLDRVFLQTSADEEPVARRRGQAWVLLQQTVGLVQALGLSVVCEGVEDAPTRDALRALGADFAQGYYMGRPMPAEKATAWVRRCERLSPSC